MSEQGEEMGHNSMPFNNQDIHRDYPEQNLDVEYTWQSQVKVTKN